MGPNSTPGTRPLLAPSVTSSVGRSPFGDYPCPQKRPRPLGALIQQSGMYQPLSKRTPIANDPVGSLVGEFIEEKRKEIQEEKARRVPKKRNPFVLPLVVVLCAAIWIAPSLM